MASDIAAHSLRNTTRPELRSRISDEQATATKYVLAIIAIAMVGPFLFEWGRYFVIGQWVGEPADFAAAQSVIYMAHAATASAIVVFWLMQATLGLSMLKGRKTYRRKAHRISGYIAAAMTIAICAIAFANLYDIYVEDRHRHFNDMDVAGLSMTAIIGTGFILSAIVRARVRDYEHHLDDIIFALAIFSSTGTIRLIELPLADFLPSLLTMTEANPIRALPVVGSGLISVLIWFWYARMRSIVFLQWGKLLVILIIFAVFTGMYFQNLMQT